MKWSWVIALLTVCVQLSSGAVVIETVTVGNPGNIDDTHDEGYGAVDYAYRIGAYEVTAGQYTEFLNAVAQADPYGLWSENMWDSPTASKIQRSGPLGAYVYSVAAEWADRPVNFVSFWDSARFANWLQNGQPTGPQGPGTTEDGAYILDGYIGEAGAEIVRQPGAFWFIPNEDEWYKAAYHMNDGATGNYWDYPTSTNAVPSNALVDPDPGNNANFEAGGETIGDPYHRTEYGEFENSPSPYGTYDQGGNVWEWNESVSYVFGQTGYRGRRGGSYDQTHSYLHASSHSYINPGADASCVGGLGFRVACLPEPVSVTFLAAGVVALLFRQRKVRK